MKNETVKRIQISSDTIVLSFGAIHLLRKMLAREELETQKLFDVAAHWPKYKREELENLTDEASIKPLAELENFVRTQELIRAYQRKNKPETKD